MKSIARRGGETIKKALSEIGDAPVFRSIIGIHFFERVFWTHWNGKDRGIVLDLAAELLKPLGVFPNKGKLKRLIGKDAKAEDQPPTPPTA